MEIRRGQQQCWADDKLTLCSGWVLGCFCPSTDLFFFFLPSTIPFRVRPGTLPGSRLSSVRSTHGLQVWHRRLCVVLLQHGLPPPGGEEGGVLGRRSPHVERAAAKVCGYVVSCFFSILFSLFAYWVSQSYQVCGIKFFSWDIFRRYDNISVHFSAKFMLKLTLVCSVWHSDSKAMRSCSLKKDTAVEILSLLSAENSV